MQRVKHRQLSCTWLSAVATVLASSNEEKLAQCTMEFSMFFNGKNYNILPACQGYDKDCLLYTGRHLADPQLICY